MPLHEQRFESLGRFVASIKMAYVPRTRVRMRVGGIGDRSRRTIIRDIGEGNRIVREHRLGSALTGLQKNISKVSQFWRRTRSPSD